MKCVKLDQCAMTRTVNLPNLIGYDKKCQVKYEETQSSSLQSVPKTACKQIGTEPEVHLSPDILSSLNLVFAYIKDFLCIQMLIYPDISRFLY